VVADVVNAAEVAAAVSEIDVAAAVNAEPRDQLQSVIERLQCVGDRGRNSRTVLQAARIPPKTSGLNFLHLRGAPCPLRELAAVGRVRSLGPSCLMACPMRRVWPASIRPFLVDQFRRIDNVGDGSLPVDRSRFVARPRRTLRPKLPVRSTAIRCSKPNWPGCSLLRAGCAIRSAANAAPRSTARTRRRSIPSAFTGVKAA
jgi:hypothetical protein